MNNYLMYGMDWNGPLSDEDDFEQVGVVNTCNPLEPIDFAQLQDYKGLLTHLEAVKRWE